MERIAVLSAKGGVGKSLISVSLARSLAKNGRVAILDADLEKPSVNIPLGLYDAEVTTEGERFVPAEKDGIEVMSTSLAFPKMAALLWDRRQERDAAKQLMELTRWKADTLIVDSAPGTGPTAQGIMNGGIDYALLVSTPDPLSLEGARRSLGLIKEYETPLLGLILNRCRDVRRIEIRGGKLRWELHKSVRVSVPIIAKIPEDPGIATTMRIPGFDSVARAVLKAMRKPLHLKRVSLARKLRRRGAKFVLRRL